MRVFTFFKLDKWYQIAQSITDLDDFKKTIYLTA